MEKYTIRIGNGWSIENKKNVDQDIKFDKIDLVKLKIPFAECEFYKDEINWIQEPFFIKDDWITICKNIDAFNQTVEFQHNKKSFKGTFIDALEYIQKEFIDV